ncbi:LuxR C-terminal-related transcriptional regulator [Pseudonocardia sp. N23]|uniref:LuxR C-terminal-related transcriptional regulator n=1 Tax=Pseudonocardia sp. N23 TaxID=1987376 RepID=UPI000C034EAD|nr:LuxR C-terminal-related transcriptional regulator [Pseudonocardia sp. N23]GAY10034.1 regulatory protein, LuxR [Pseudonocardia sp. N23]
MPIVPGAKISVPALPPEFVGRPHLSAALDAPGGPDVALVCAPAGYGKSLLLADRALADSATETVWVTLDADDNAPGRLWAAVLAALTQCPSVCSLEPLHERSTTRPEFVAELAEALQDLPSRVRVILDDVHELVDPQVLRQVQSFVRAKPVTVQLVLASRLDPPLSLPRLRLTGRLWELRAAEMALTREQAAAMLERSGLCLSPTEIEVLHRRTGGWAAGLRLAALGLRESSSPDEFLAQFSGDDRSVADYLIGEILSGLPSDIRGFLRVISISDPVPVGLAAELTARDEAGSVLHGLERRTSLVTALDPLHEVYRVQELLRTHLTADLHRQGAKRLESLHRDAARWWAGQDQPLRALDHAARSRDPELLLEVLRRSAIRLVLTGEHAALRRALTGAHSSLSTDDPWLLLASALANLEAGDLSAAHEDLNRVSTSWDSRPDTAELAVLHVVAEQFETDRTTVAARTSEPVRAIPTEPELEALARLSRGGVQLEQNDLVAARSNLDAALALSRRHDFDFLELQCLVLLGVAASGTGDLRTMRSVSTEALAVADGHAWEGSTWSGAAAAMLGYSDLLRADPVAAARRTERRPETDAAESVPLLRYVLRAVHGAALFDLGERAAGLAELQQSRSDFGDHEAAVERVAAMAVLEFCAARTLGHSVAARTVLTWLTEQADGSGEVSVMQAWSDSAAGRHERARSLVRSVLDGDAPPLLPATMVDAWLLETSIALAAGERHTARHALRSALAVGDLLDAVRPFAQADPIVRELLVAQRGSFGPSGGFADRVLAARAGEPQETMLSEREITVLGLLPSMLSLDEIATDLTVSVNTVKTHVRSIYTKLGVSSRRLAVLAAHQRGLIATGVR